jgi:hypothetical protein
MPDVWIFALSLVAAVLADGSLPYDEALARRMAGFSACMYCEDCLQTSALPCEACQINADTVINGSFVYEKDRILSAVFVHVAEKAVVVAFRGTAPTEVRNYVADIDIRKEDADYIEGRTHNGFTDAFRGVRDQTPLLQTVAALAERFPTFRVVVTGHSLGAALATLCTVALASTTTLGSRLLFYGFGSPLVGDERWANNVNALFQEKSVTFYRVVHNRDPVCAIPPTLFGFRHIANEVFYDDDMDPGKFELCRSSHEGKCSDDLTLRVAFDDHLFYFDIFVGLSCGAVSGTSTATLPPSAPNLLCAMGVFGASGECVDEKTCRARGGDFHTKISAMRNAAPCAGGPAVGCCVPIAPTPAPTATELPLFISAASSSASTMQLFFF